MTKIEANRIVRNHYRNWNTLKELAPKILNQVFWQKRIPISEKLQFISALSSAEQSMWEAVHAQTGNAAVYSSLRIIDGAEWIEYEEKPIPNTPAQGEEK